MPPTISRRPPIVKATSAHSPTTPRPPPQRARFARRHPHPVRCLAIYVRRRRQPHLASRPQKLDHTRAYDALGRLLTESNAGTTQVTNTYDTCLNGIGFLCIASTTAAKTQNAYDILGRLSYATTTIAGINFTSSSTYDRQGNIATLTYPNGAQTNYGYNLAGQILSRHAQNSGRHVGRCRQLHHLCAYRTALDFHVRQRCLHHLELRCRRSISSRIPPNHGRQQHAHTKHGLPVRQHRNIIQIANLANTPAFGITTFTYDALNRLTSASTTGSYTTSSVGILDTLPLSIYQIVGTSDSRSYTVPAGGTNNLFLVLLTNGNSTTPSATLNGAALTFVRINGTANRAYYFVGYLANPTRHLHDELEPEYAGGLHASHRRQRRAIQSDRRLERDNRKPRYDAHHFRHHNPEQRSPALLPGGLERKSDLLRLWRRRDANDHCAKPQFGPLDRLVQTGHLDGPGR